VAPITTATSPVKSNKLSDMAAQSPPASRLVEGKTTPAKRLAKATFLRLHGVKIRRTVGCS